MDRSDVGVIRCDGMVGSGADDDTEVAVVTSAELAWYGLIICSSLLIEVLEVFVGWVSADGGQSWVLEIDLFEVYFFGCFEHLQCDSFVN